ncbi:MAG: hypothetical protein VX777_06220 [Chlamydiota bacterium]|nr:hypothetical protein [Chlamydiota bacterium]
MTEQELLQRVALLESINDHLSTEVDYVDKLMKMIGFKHGLMTVKATAADMIKRGLVEVTDFE